MKKIIVIMIFGVVVIGMYGVVFVVDLVVVQYKVDKVKVDVDYKVVKKKCGFLKGNDKDVCEKEVKVVYEFIIVDVKVKCKGVEVDKDVMKDKNDVNYDVVKEKCDVMSGDVKDKCVVNVKVKFGK